MLWTLRLGKVLVAKRALSWTGIVILVLVELLVEEL
jgi:hypothetical protein